VKDFSKTHIIFLVLFLITGLGGGYFWYWSISDLEAKTKEKADLQSQLGQLDKLAMPPTQAMLSKLQDNEKEFKQLSEKSLAEIQQMLGQFDSLVLKQEADKPPQGLSNDAWKKQMNDRRLDLDKLALKNKVDVPKDFFYGFQKYRLTSPDEKSTGRLGFQLLGADAISKILINAKVNKFLSLRRAPETDVGKPGTPVATSSGTSGNGNEDVLGAAILTGPQKLYQIYPFEVAIRCDTQQLRDVINGLNTSDYFFIIRFLAIENEKLNVKSKSAIQSEVVAEATRKGSLVIPVAGNELLQVRIRIDMLVWSKQAFSAESEKAPAARGGAR